MAGSNSQGGQGDPEAVVRSFCRDVPARDRALLLPYFSQRIVYHNIPMDPAVGVDATMAVLDMFIGMCDALEFRILNLATAGNAVLTERIDVLTIGGRESPLPVMGIFEVEDGLITAWRDYFDMAQVTAAVSPD